MIKILHNIRLAYIFAVFFFLLTNVNKGFTQGLYVGSGATFIKKDVFFTTSNTVVEVDANGSFIVDAGNDWGSATEYVNGKITAAGSGFTKLPLGNNGVYAPIFVNQTNDVVGEYFNATPPSGSNGVDVDAVADVEYWEISGSGIVTLPWNENSGIESLVNNNGGKLSSVAIVGYSGGIWDLVSTPLSNVVNGDLQNGEVSSDPNNEVNFDGFTQFTFGIDHQEVLSVNELFLNNGISILSNPVRLGEENIRFLAENEMNNLRVTLYDILGRTVRLYEGVKTYGKIGSLKKPNIPRGIYLLKFEFEGKQGVKKIIIE